MHTITLDKLEVLLKALHYYAEGNHENYSGSLDFDDYDTSNQYKWHPGKKAREALIATGFWKESKNEID